MPFQPEAACDRVGIANADTREQQTRSFEPFKKANSHILATVGTQVAQFADKLLRSHEAVELQGHAPFYGAIGGV